MDMMIWAETPLDKVYAEILGAKDAMVKTQYCFRNAGYFGMSVWGF